MKNLFCFLFLFIFKPCIAQEKQGVNYDNFKEDWPIIQSFIDSLSRKGLDTGVFYGKNYTPSLMKNHEFKFHCSFFSNEKKVNGVFHIYKQNVPRKKTRFDFESKKFNVFAIKNILRQVDDSTIYSEFKKTVEGHNDFPSHGLVHYFYIKRGDKVFFRYYVDFPLNKEFWKNYRTLFIIASAFNNSKFE